MKTILYIGGEAHGLHLIDVGQERATAAASPARFTTVVEGDNERREKWVDGYRRVRFDHQGWPAVAMLEETLRVEDMDVLAAGLKIETNIDPNS